MNRDIFLEYFRNSGPENSKDQDIPNLDALGAWSEEDKSKFYRKGMEAEYRRAIRALPRDLLDAKGNPIERLHVERITPKGDVKHAYVQRAFLSVDDTHYVLNESRKKCRYFWEKHQRILDDAIKRADPKIARKIKRLHQHDCDFMRSEIAKA